MGSTGAAGGASGAEPRFARLAALLSGGGPVLVQTHDYPDSAAGAAAWGLVELLGRRGVAAEIGYRGEIRSRSLARLLAELAIPIRDLSRAGGSEADAPGRRVVVVDGSPSNGNVSLVPGGLVGVVDHHCKVGEPLAPFVDVRPGLASCSSIIQGYWAETGEPMPRPIATALLAGIQSDTDFLSRRASPEDFAAYAELFAAGDFEKASRIVRTVLDLGELELVTRALDEAEIRDGLLWACLPGPCGQEVLAVLAEFVLRTEELRAAVVAELDAPGPHAPDGAGARGVHLSVRSKDPALSAFSLVRAALEGIGAGGGHSHSAGGFVPAASFPGEAALRERFFALVGKIAP
ncbi:MAG: DHH family phosphoesterase [Spirochaetaceae bacterium]|nr:DHH family phosphoesterase [Spirochaetaceae bacterium]